CCSCPWRCRSPAVARNRSPVRRPTRRTLIRASTRMSDDDAPGAPDFADIDGQLHAEAVPLAAIATAVGTPFYCYSSTAIERRYRRFAAAFAGERAEICYAVKANSNLAVIRLLARLGAGADVVSEGELRRALAAGVPAERIVFSGIGKTAAEIAF